MSPVILQGGNCERLKAAAHTVAFGIAAICGVYNLAAWLVRRQTHLAVNATIYGAAVVWEANHIRHHLAAIAAAGVPATSVPEERSGRGAPMPRVSGAIVSGSNGGSQPGSKEMRVA